MKLGAAGWAVAHNVKALREARGLTQTDVSDRMGALGRPLLPTGVLKVEQGARRVDVDDLVALALALDATPNDLLGPLDERDRGALQMVERAVAALQDVQAMLTQASLVTTATVIADAEVVKPQAAGAT